MRNIRRRRCSLEPRGASPPMNQSTKLFSLSKYFMSGAQRLIGRGESSHAIVNIEYRILSSGSDSFGKQGFKRVSNRSGAPPASRPTSARGAASGEETSSMLWHELDGARHPCQPDGAEVVGHALETMRGAPGRRDVACGNRLLEVAERPGALGGHTRENGEHVLLVHVAAPVVHDALIDQAEDPPSASCIRGRDRSNATRSGLHGAHIICRALAAPL